MIKIDIFEENKRLREELEQERKLRKEWQKKYYELLERFNKLEKKLEKILNSNTPSSCLPFTEKDTNRSPNRNAIGTHPRGKPKGSHGDTRPIPKSIDKKYDAKAKKCPHCKSHNLKHIGTNEKYVCDLPDLKLIVTLFSIYTFLKSNASGLKS